ncbi:hypothetical protein MKP05_05595 [Halomonas sp. EGI 63088]|uniref:Lipoprotein n=1 Tax=Halomonas flagellata TaxID=2920385 RepID=A0ABS9RRZ2_9GAMM|nr:hypothetical protein [Halomonas flagellata]MCH4562609.1 hypothetical protein [Halomonas flagellata]
MKAWCRLSSMGLVALLLLAGCGGNENGTKDPESTEEASEEMAMEEPAPEPEPRVEPFSEPVEIDFVATLRSDRRLMVEGESNLPDSARLLIVVEREASGVRWQSRTSLEEGHFAAGPFGPGSGLPDGGYRITVNLPVANVQPLAVRQRIGEQGEHLSGPLVSTSRHGLGQVASSSRRFLVGSEPRRTTDQVEVLGIE